MILTSSFSPFPRGKVHFGKSGKCSLRQVRQMLTSAIRQIFILASPANVHFCKSGKFPPRQVRQMLTSVIRQMFPSASPVNAHLGKSGKCSLQQSGKCSFRQVRDTTHPGRHSPNQHNRAPPRTEALRRKPQGTPTQPTYPANYKLNTLIHRIHIH